MCPTPGDSPTQASRSRSWWTGARLSSMVRSGNNSHQRLVYSLPSRVMTHFRANLQVQQGQYSTPQPSFLLNSIFTDCCRQGVHAPGLGGRREGHLRRPQPHVQAGAAGGRGEGRERRGGQQGTPRPRRAVRRRTSGQGPRQAGRRTRRSVCWGREAEPRGFEGRQRVVVNIKSSQIFCTFNFHYLLGMY